MGDTIKKSLAKATLEGHCIKKIIEKKSNKSKIYTKLILGLGNIQKISTQMAGIQEILGKNDKIVKAMLNKTNIAINIPISFPSFKDSIHPMIKSLFEISKYSEQIIKEIEGEKDICKDSKFKEFPFLCAEYLTIPEMRMLKKEWNKGNKKEVIEVIKSTLRKEGIHKEILTSIDRKKPLKKREKLFEQALWAHRNGKYILSIPLLFPIIEGTLVDKYGYLFKESKCPKCKMKRRATANPVLETVRKKLKKSKKQSIFSEQYIAQIEHLLDSFSSNRNPVLHGSKIDYADETLSAALILAVISLDFDDGLDL